MRFIRFMADVVLFGFVLVTLFVVMIAGVYGFLALLSYGGVVAVATVTAVLAAVNLAVWAYAVSRLRRR